jgi:hypothetical protein
MATVGSYGRGASCEQGNPVGLVASPLPSQEGAIKKFQELRVKGRPLPRRTALPNGTVLNLRKTSLQKYGVVPRRARIQGSHIVESLYSRLENNREETEG